MPVNSYYTISNPNYLVAANNYADSGILTAASGNSLNSAFLLTNAQIANLYTFARIDNHGSDESTPFPEDNFFTGIYVDLQKQRSIGLVALLKTNITSQGNVRVIIWTDGIQGSNQVFDSGWLPANGATPGYGGLVWGAFQWGDAIPDANLTKFNRHTFVPMQTVVGRYVGIYFDDPTLPQGGSNTYIQFARVWVSSAYQPSINVSYGAEVQIIDETPKTQMQAGNREYGTTPILRRQVNVNFDDLTISEVISNILGPLFMNQGISGEIICMVQPADIASINYQSVYGTIPALDKAVHQSYNRMGTTLSVEEQV